MLITTYALSKLASRYGCVSPARLLTQEEISKLAEIYPSSQVNHQSYDKVFVSMPQGS